MSFTYRVSPLPPVIGIRLKDIHRLRESTDISSSRSQLDEPVLFVTFFLLLCLQFCLYSLGYNPQLLPSHLSQIPAVSPTVCWYFDE